MDIYIYVCVCVCVCLCLCSLKYFTMILSFLIFNSFSLVTFNDAAAYLYVLY